MIEIDNQRKNASYINKLNKIEVLRLIRESGEISRADIVKKTKLSAPTVTRIVDSLINDKLAVMVGEGDSTGGRPPKLIKFDGSHNYVIGIDLGSTSIRGVISNLEGVFITEIETPTDLKSGFEKVSLQVAQLIKKLIDRSKLVEDKILGVGLAVAGLINSQSGIVEYSPVFNWRKVDLRSELKKHINIPVFYDNVSRVTALGELLYGIGKTCKNFICVNAGYGIGAGIIINGTPLYGSKGFTGEFGHIVLDRTSDYIGKDGIRGCLEALSSGYGIAEIAKIRITEGAKSSIMKHADGMPEKISAKHVIDAAKEGDALAVAIFDESMQYLGTGLDALIKLFNPEVIVLSGGLTGSGEIFFEKLREYTFTNKLQLEGDEVPLVPSSFKDDATLIGAFSLIITKVLHFDSGELEV
ncbi:ROK family transcriptional regulator [Fulvivirgaceae bacterium BMA12]|uniref:ROK family transcriptional regulator n=1 Tax=Agaribacillus aureus TaxID=3051825 RepID=A0ABT8LIQ8_9BACT|nr:ROK family transcriptional regulator [Fulvivirgaceae bacterium BMA12]